MTNNPHKVIDGEAKKGAPTSLVPLAHPSLADSHLLALALPGNNVGVTKGSKHL